MALFAGNFGIHRSPTAKFIFGNTDNYILLAYKCRFKIAFLCHLHISQSSFVILCCQRLIWLYGVLRIPKFPAKSVNNSFYAKTRLCPFLLFYSSMIKTASVITFYLSKKLQVWDEFLWEQLPNFMWNSIK